MLGEYAIPTYMFVSDKSDFWNDLMHSLPIMLLVFYLNSCVDICLKTGSLFVSRYCYYCLRTRCSATSSYRCPRCNEVVVAIQRQGSV
jgi:hypothetical protein